MEKVKVPKCRSFHRCYKRFFVICVGVRAERNSDELRREESERGSDWPGKFFLCGDWLTDNATFVQTDAGNGDLKGVGSFSASFQTALTTSGFP